MVSYFYKNVYKGITSFISCTWIKDIDLTNPSKSLSTPVCQMIVTNIHDFYKGTVTYKDLGNFKHGQIPLDVLNKLIEVALQGGEEYAGDRIDWKTVFNDCNCQMTLLGYLNNSLPIQIGTLQFDRVNDSEKMQVWTEWMEMTASQFKELKETQDALHVRNTDLAQGFNKMKTVADNLVLQKTASELALMGKFKELLNEKKRKIRKLELKYKGKDTHHGLIKGNTTNPSLASQSSPPSSSSTTKTKGRNKRIATEGQESSPSNSIKRQKSSSIEPLSTNDKTPPLNVSPASTSSKPLQQNQIQGTNDDVMDSDDDPFLTTTRSRYRKLTKSGTQPQYKADSGSDTTEDEATSD